jgi:hypothetical protein
MPGAPPKNFEKNPETMMSQIENIITHAHCTLELGPSERIILGAELNSFFRLIE